LPEFGIKIRDACNELTLFALEVQPTKQFFGSLLHNVIVAQKNWCTEASENDSPTSWVFAQVKQVDPHHKIANVHAVDAFAKQ
jgi:hypothetical protein